MKLVQIDDALYTLRSVHEEHLKNLPKSTPTEGNHFGLDLVTMFSAQNATGTRHQCAVCLIMTGGPNTAKSGFVLTLLYGRHFHIRCRCCRKRADIPGQRAPSA